MAKKGRIDVRTIYPDDAPITNIGVSHYDDDQARFGDETYMGGPWGLRAWVQLRAEQGQEVRDRRVGRRPRGDNPEYIQNMHDFLRGRRALAHEAYFNTSEYQLYPGARIPSRPSSISQLF